MDELDGFCPISDLRPVRPATDKRLGSLVLRCWEDLEGLTQLGNLRAVGSAPLVHRHGLRARGFYPMATSQRSEIT